MSARPRVGVTSGTVERVIRAPLPQATAEMEGNNSRKSNQQEASSENRQCATVKLDRNCWRGRRESASVPVSLPLASDR